MDYSKMRPALSAARPVGVADPMSSIVKSVSAVRPMRSMADMKPAITEKPRGRPTKDERKLEKRMEVMAELDELIEDKINKKKIRIYFLTRIQQLLLEKGITTA